MCAYRSPEARIDALEARVSHIEGHLEKGIPTGLQSSYFRPLMPSRPSDVDSTEAYGEKVAEIASLHAGGYLGFCPADPPAGELDPVVPASVLTIVGPCGESWLDEIRVVDDASFEALGRLLTALGLREVEHSATVVLCPRTFMRRPSPGIVGEAGNFLVSFAFPAAEGEPR